MSEHSLPIAVVSEEEWQATIRYADEHAGEIERNEPPRPQSELGKILFDMLAAQNRMLAESYRQYPPPLR